MRKVSAAILASFLFMLFTALFAATTVATPAQSTSAQSTPAQSTPAQSDCSALNAAKGEGKFTGQIASPPKGSSMEVTYGGQTVLVHYNNSVTVCQGGQAASLNALTNGASVVVFGPLRRNGKNMEMDAARIFVAGPPQTARPSPERAPALPNAQQPQPAQPRPAQPLRPLQPAQPLRPLTIGQRAVPNSVILGGGTYEATIQRLHAVRKYALSDIRTNSQVTWGEARLDFRPMLNNPKALFNIAQQLHQMPQHVQVLQEASEISEVEQGLVIHQVLAYHILPGKCADPDAKAQLARAGAHCFARASTSERLAEFSNPDSPRYVADPGKRQAATAAFQRNSAASDAEATGHIADLRKSLADPNQRAAIVAQIGQAETTRMDSLGDDQLKEEVINSGVQQFEETMFVPRLESANYAHPQHTLTIAASPAEMAAVQQLLRDGVPEHGGAPSNFPKLLKVVPETSLHLAGSTAPGGDKVGDVALGPYYFLTGFTIGHDYEWNWGAQVTINWCIVGCSSTYGFDLYAGFNYGFGLRFPIQAQLKYHTVVHPNNSAEANLTADFEPIQGNVEEFLSAQIPAEQLYDAKELVAQVGANAGFDVNLGVVNANPNFQVGVDFTKMLPDPYKGGSFTPPAPGTGGINSPFVFDQVDLLSGLLNYGVIGGQVFPAINVNLHSNKLEFTLNDEILKRQTVLTSNPHTVALGATPIPVGSYSHFSLGNPVYNLGFTLTPGLEPNIFVDIAVWSDSWKFPIWFPQLSVTVPSNGIDFACHAGTTCVVDFAPTYNAKTGQTSDTKAEQDAADRTLQGGGCQRVNGQEGYYLCPVKGMLGLCKAMLNNGAVFSCGALVPNVVDEILKRGHCTVSDGAYVCPKDMMGLCDVYLKNQEILSCKAK